MIELEPTVGGSYFSPYFTIKQVGSNTATTSGTPSQSTANPTSGTPSQSTASANNTVVTFGSASSGAVTPQQYSGPNLGLNPGQVAGVTIATIAGLAILFLVIWLELQQKIKAKRAGLDAVVADNSKGSISNSDVEKKAASSTVVEIVAANKETRVAELNAVHNDPTAGIPELGGKEAATVSPTELASSPSRLHQLNAAPAVHEIMASDVVHEMGGPGQAAAVGVSAPAGLDDPDKSSDGEEHFVAAGNSVEDSAVPPVSQNEEQRIRDLEQAQARLQERRRRLIELERVDEEESRIAKELEELKGKTGNAP